VSEVSLLTQSSILFNIPNSFGVLDAIYVYCCDVGMPKHHCLHSVNHKGESGHI